MVKALNGSHFVLILILLFAFLLRTGSVNYGLPFVEDFTADGEHYVLDGVQVAGTRNWNPGWFGHPGSTVIYSLAIVFGVSNRIDRFLGTSDAFIVDQFQQDPSSFYFIGRLFATFCAVLAIAVVYQFGRQVKDCEIGLIAAALLAVSPLHIFISRLARTDAPVIFLANLSLLGSLLLLKKPLWKYYLLAGASAGLAMSTKYYGVVAVVALPTAHFLRSYMDSKKHVNSESRTSWIKLMIGLACLPIAFMLTSPFAVIEWRTTLDDLLKEGRSTHLGADGLSPLENFWWYISQVLPAGLGWVATLLIPLGMGKIFRSFPRTAVVGGTFLICFFSLISVQQLHWDRWLSPLLPAIVILAAAGFQEFIHFLSGMIPDKRRTRLIRALCLVGFVFQPFVLTMRDTIDRVLPDTRLLSRAWIRDNLPKGSRIALELYTAPLEMDEYVISKAFSLSREPLTAYCQREMQYLVLSSEIYKRYAADPIRYRENLDFYRQLPEEAVIYQAAPIPWSIGGPTVTVYSLSNCEDYLP